MSTKPRFKFSWPAKKKAAKTEPQISESAYRWSQDLNPIGRYAFGFLARPLDDFGMPIDESNSTRCLWLRELCFWHSVLVRRLAEMHLAGQKGKRDAVNIVQSAVLSAELAEAELVFEQPFMRRVIRRGRSMLLKQQLPEAIAELKLRRSQPNKS